MNNQNETQTKQQTPRYVKAWIEETSTQTGGKIYGMAHVKDEDGIEIPKCLVVKYWGTESVVNTDKLTAIDEVEKEVNEMIAVGLPVNKVIRELYNENIIEQIISQE